MTRIAFCVPGRPSPAVRMTQRGVHAANHPKRAAIDRYLQFKDNVGWAAKAAIAVPLSGDVRLTLDFYLVPGQRADLDNYCKAALDGLNAVAFADDRQVTHLEAMILPAKDKRQEMTRIMVEGERE